MNPWKSIGLSDYENHMSLESVQQLQALNLSCVIRLNPKTAENEESKWVSDSPYLHAFDGLDEVHHQMEEDALWRCLKELGFDELDAYSTPLPNGKYLLRIDFAKPMK